MKRKVALSEISDGRLYSGNDMVKADCHGCEGCSQCCRGMGNSIILDPCDVYRLQVGAGYSLARLLAEEKAELNVVDGLVLPNLKMSGAGEQCAFLDTQGRCSIHESRPGICRIFPLGRYYENGDYRYFLQIGECRVQNRSKVKVSKWIDTPRQKENHDFILTWHYFLNELEEQAAASDGECQKKLNLLLLQIFFLTDYLPEQDFYGQFAGRLEKWKKHFAGIIDGDG